MTKKQYLYSNLFAWSLVLFLIANHIFGWTIPSQDPPGGNITPSFSKWSSSGSDIYYNDGNVGIGTVSPGSKLEINGNVNIEGSLTSSNLISQAREDALKNAGDYVPSGGNLNTLLAGSSGLYGTGSEGFPSGLGYSSWGYVETQNMYQTSVLNKDIIQWVYPFRGAGTIAYRTKDNNEVWSDWNALATKEYVDSSIEGGEIESYNPYNGSWAKVGDLLYQGVNGVWDTSGNYWTINASGFVTKNGSTYPSGCGTQGFGWAKINDRYVSDYSDYCKYCASMVLYETGNLTTNSYTVCSNVTSGCICSGTTASVRPRQITCHNCNTNLRW